MDKQILGLLRFFGICFTACLSLSQGFNIEMPASVMAVEGSCVLVPCQTKKHSRVIWYKYQSSGWPVVYDGGNAGSAMEQFKGRTSVSGPASDGNCTLRINNVRSGDGIKLFPYINPESDKYYKPTVQIKTQARAPPVILGPESPVVEGEVLNISCSIQHSCPPSPPSIEWRGLSVETTEVSTERTDAGLWVTVATAKVTAAQSLDGTQIHCRSTSTDDVSQESKHVNLSILFAPADVKTSAESRMVAEHSNITLGCESTGNPTPHLYQWFIANGRHSFQVNTTRENISINDVQRNFSSACIAHNTIGSARSPKTTLDVAFVSIKLSDSSCSEAGRILSCICWVEAHPVATVTWFSNGSSDLTSSVVPVITHKGNLTSSEIMLEGTLAEQGPVVCVATNSHRTDTHQMTLLDKTISLPASLPWIVLACAFGFLGFCGLICFCRHRRQRNSHDPSLPKDNIVSRQHKHSDDSININLESRPKEEPKARGKRTRAPRPEEHKLRNKTKQHGNVFSPVEMDNVYDNDPVAQAQRMSQEEDAENIYLNNMEDDDADNIYLNS